MSNKQLKQGQNLADFEEQREEILQNFADEMARAVESHRRKLERVQKRLQRQLSRRLEELHEAYFE